jgi:hypothetical protein
MMLEQLGIHYEPNILTVIGVLIAVSFLGSKLFQRVGIPQVLDSSSSAWCWVLRFSTSFPPR